MGRMKRNVKPTTMLRKHVSFNGRYRAFQKREVWRFLEKHNGKTRFIPSTQRHKKGFQSTHNLRAKKRMLKKTPGKFEAYLAKQEKKEENPNRAKNNIMNMKFFELNPLAKKGKIQKLNRKKHDPARTDPKRVLSRRLKWNKAHRNKKRTEIYPKLKKGLVPGTVCIILCGHYASKKCIFLKQLYNGLLLVNGPFYANGVPLRRVAQCYVIATKTRLDIKDLDLSKYNNKYFLKKARPVDKKAGEDFFEEQKKRKQTPSDEQKAMQKALDIQLMKRIKKVPSLRKYISCRFKLRKDQFPHKMTF